MKLLRGIKMKLSKKILAVAAVLAASAMVFVGCKGIGANDDGIESKNKREQSAEGKAGASDSTTYTRFYKEFGTSENVYEADCEITLTGGNSKKTAAGFMFGLHTDKDSKKKSAFVAAVRLLSGKPEFYVSHFSDFTDDELKDSTRAEIGTEDAGWALKDWCQLDSGGFTYDPGADKLTVTIKLKTDSDGKIDVKVGNNTVTINNADYSAFSNKVDVEKKVTKFKGYVIGKIASYGVIYPTSAAPANKLTATWKVSNDKVTIGTLNAEVVEE
ncbi:MAG: hypothetical protein ACTTKB_06695 [Treponema sp.]